MVFDNKTELASGKIDPETNQFQNICVMLRGLERQVYILTSDKVGLQNFSTKGMTIEQQNELFQQNGQITQDKDNVSIKYEDKLHEELVN